MLKLLAVALTIAGTVSGTALAQSGTNSAHSGHQGHGTATLSPADKAYGDAMVKMHQDMDIKLSGNADVDFVRGMIPHHQGAIDMAKVVLEYGKDPEIKELATTVIKDQEAEIDKMKAWLAKNGG